MQYTDNYQFNKPTIGVDMADIRTENANWDKADAIIHGSQISLAEGYDATRTAAEPYNTGDVVMYNFVMYACKEDGVFGAWDATKWERTTASAHGAGGGSDVSITPTLATGTKIADYEIDGVQGELYAPNGGGGGGGSSQTIADVLWSGAETPRYPTTYTANLAHSIKDYDILIFDGTETDYSQLVKFVIDTSSITYNEVYLQISDGDSGFAMTFIDDQTIELASYASTHPTTYTKITGLKFCGTLAPMIYSTEEREVGCWIDNKPLYQKTFDLTSQTLTDNAWNNGILGTTGISIKSYKGYFSLGTGSLFPYEYYRNNSEFFTVTTDQNSSDINVRPNMNAGTPVYAGNVTVWYTKDSDVAGSGSWASNGVPAHHYSTEEQVVGTWLDGSTVYEKTWDLGENTTYSPGWHLLSFPKGNINRIFDGLLISDAGLSCNVGLACNDATYLEILVYSGPSQVVGRYIKARYTKSTI